MAIETLTKQNFDTDVLQAAEPELARQYNIEVIPTLLIFQNGAHGDRLVAPDSQAKLEAWIHEQC